MVILQVLPPVDGPVQLTANAHPRSLHEHFLAFLNANNEHGFVANDIASLDEDTIGNLLLLVATKDVLSEHDVKSAAAEIKKLSGRAIKHSYALEIVSALIGYPNYHSVQKNIAAKQVVENLHKNRNLINMKIFDIRNT